MAERSERCGYVAIVGRPNVGKSTLLNHLVGSKISITSKKPQTTRHRLLGIKTVDDVQALYVDTPGIHEQGQRAINRYMNRSARSVLRDVDSIIFVVDRDRWHADDDVVAELLKRVDARLFVVPNKIDLLEDKRRLLPCLESLQARFPDADIVPVSALGKDNLDRLEALVLKSLPQGAFLFPEDQLTDRSERFLVSEIIREKMMRHVGDEVPYELTVAVDRFHDDGKTIHIDATALVERKAQKPILIGKGGERLKRIGSDARKDIEAALDRRVMLSIRVKVKSGWSDDDRALKSLGYDDV